MVCVLFESFLLYYLKYWIFLLNLEDLFVKIVNWGWGGYCMEVNVFFVVVLWSLGFMFFSIGGRVRGDVGYKGW